MMSKYETRCQEVRASRVLPSRHQRYFLVSKRFHQYLLARCDESTALLYSTATLKMFSVAQQE